MIVLFHFKLCAHKYQVFFENYFIFITLYVIIYEIEGKVFL